MERSQVRDRTGANRSVIAWLVAATILSVALAGLLAVVVPAGQPYDEPSHWDTVQYYADHHRLPRLGDPGVTYEAQMGPVAYTVGAVEVVVFGAERGFSAFRWTNALLCGAIVVLTFLLARQLYPERPWFGVWAAAFTGTLPTVVAFSGSVQNDTLAVVLSLASALVVLRTLEPGREPSIWRWCAAGVLVSLAVLAKVQSIALLPALLIAVAAMPGPRRRAAIKGACVASLTVVLGTGWWFVRNLALYGDLTGTEGMAATGNPGSSRPFDLHNVVGLVRATVSVVWAPTEYYRNAFEAPLVLRMLTVLVTGLAVVAVVGAASRWISSRRSGRGLLRELRESSRADAGRTFTIAWILITLLAWLVLVFTKGDASPRVLAVVAAPTVVLLGQAVAGVLRRTGGRRVVRSIGVALICFVVSVDLWLASEVAQISPQPFWIEGV